MAQNLPAWFDPNAVQPDTWDGTTQGLNQSHPAIGVNTGDFDPKETDWTREQRLTLPVPFIGYPSDATPTADANPGASFGQAVGAIAPDDPFAGGTNRTGKTIPDGSWAWGEDARTGGEYQANIGAFFDGLLMECVGANGAGLTNSKTFTMSLWAGVDATGVGSLQYFLGTDTGTINLRNQGGNTQVRIVGSAPGPTQILNTNPGALITAGVWHHFLVSVDMANPANRHYYLDGVDAGVTWSTYDDNVFDWQRNFHVAGSSAGPSTAGAFQEVYLSQDYTDLSIQANREMFILNNKPAQDLTNVGNPVIYLNNPSATFGTNKGSLADMPPTVSLLAANSAPEVGVAI